MFFGQHDWDLPPAPRPHPELKERCAVFAAALLAGQVIQPQTLHRLHPISSPHPSWREDKALSLFISVQPQPFQVSSVCSRGFAKRTDTISYAS